MKRHIFLALSLFCFLLSGLCLFSIKRGQDEILASRISSQVLRFHVLANSDSRQDQQLKMEVKSLIVDQISREMSGCGSKDEMCSYLLENSARLTDLAASFRYARIIFRRKYMEILNFPAAPTMPPGW